MTPDPEVVCDEEEPQAQQENAKSEKPPFHESYLVQLIEVDSELPDCDMASRLLADGYEQTRDKPNQLSGTLWVLDEKSHGIHRWTNSGHPSPCTRTKKPFSFAGQRLT